MVNLYIDESGSMTTEFLINNPYFLISIIKPNNIRKIKTNYKRFIKQNYNLLKSADKNQKMFQNGIFKELKGSEFTPDLKKQFIEYMCRDNMFDIFYIIIDNKLVDKSFYNNTARAFNYSIKLALTHFRKRNYLPDDEYSIQLDERNQKTKTKYFLEEYLNTELYLQENLITHNISVQYFDSCNNIIVQIADVFANIMFSELMTNNYTNNIEKITSEKYIKKIFKFPKK